MTERDRVLDAFRNCITEPKCKDCPWTECETIGNGTIEIPRDLALAVMRELVAQEPRVMALEEIPETVFGWIETKMYGQIIPCVLEDVYADDTVGFASIDDGHDYMCASDYGKTWRCWTSRPTVEQMEAIPWERSAE